MEDNIVHLLLKCEHVKAVWEKLKEYVKSIFGNSIEADFNDCNIILNNVHPKSTHVINTMVLICKQMIYRYKYNGEKIRFPIILHEITKYKNIKYYIAKKSSKLKTHQEKWLPQKSRVNGNNYGTFNNLVQHYIEMM